MFWNKKDIEEEKQDDEFEIVLLKTVNDNYQLELIKNLLEDEGIQFILKDEGAGGYMRVIAGASIFSTDILVASRDFTRAKEIIDELPWNE